VKGGFNAKNRQTNLSGHNYLLVNTMRVTRIKKGSDRDHHGGKHEGGMLNVCRLVKKGNSDEDAGHRIEVLAKNHVSSEPIREVLVLNNDMVEKLIMTMLETNDTVRGKIRDYLVDPTIENLEEPAELLLQMVRAKGIFNPDSSQRNSRPQDKRTS